MSDNDQDDISAADEQALRAMFAALVDDAAPSELSPLEVRRSATAENDATLDRRLKRLKFTRNALVAAALAGVVALVLPHLGNSSSTATAASSASSAAAAPAAAPAAASSAAATSAASSAAAGAIPQSAGAAADGSSAASSAPASGAASGSSAAGGAAPAPAAGSSASGSAASSGAMSSGGASSAGASGGSSPAGTFGSSAASGVAGCVPGSARWLAPVRAALPGYRGTVRISSCSVEDSRGSAAGTVTFVVTATSAVCQGAADAGCRPVAGTPVPGTKDAYANGAAVTVVGARGVSVTVTSTAGGPERQALITAARALLTTIG